MIQLCTALKLEFIFKCLVNYYIAIFTNKLIRCCDKTKVENEHWIQFAKQVMI